jgi:hypothetical protein
LRRRHGGGIEKLFVHGEDRRQRRLRYVDRLAQFAAQKMNFQRRVAMKKLRADFVVRFDGAARIVFSFLQNRHVGENAVQRFDAVLADGVRIRRSLAAKIACKPK